MIVEADEIVVRTSRNSGQYKKGYTGTFTISGNTLNFVNGILV